MHLTPTDIYTYYRPSECDLRVYLRANGEPEAPASPFEELIRQLGNRHEKRHLLEFKHAIDLSAVQLADLESQTRKLIAEKVSVIYQPLFRASVNLDGYLCEVVGRPDFLIYETDSYIIRDSKISRHITEDEHPEIIMQLQLYGWLYRQTFGTAPLRLEVHNGINQIVRVQDDGGLNVLQKLREIVQIKQLSQPPYSPVGWSKCTNCSFYKRCWSEAEGKQDVALVFGIDTGLAKALHADGITNIGSFLDHFDEVKLANFHRPYGKRLQRVGKPASSILSMAKAMFTSKESMLAKPDIAIHQNYVMFDLEGLPPQLDDIEKIYLWGMQVFGQTPGPFMPAVAGFGADSDREVWFDFLDKANQIFKTYGDLPFVHWHDYEKTKINMYINRFGDHLGIATRVLQNLLNILPITKQCFALPLPSYSLKIVEKYVGFERTQTEYGGDWSIAQYIQAIETEDPELREQVMEQLLTYNKEDLQATWAVFQWLRQKATQHSL